MTVYKFATVPLKQTAGLIDIEKIKLESTCYNEAECK